MFKKYKKTIKNIFKKLITKIIKRNNWRKQQKFEIKKKNKKFEKNNNKNLKKILKIEKKKLKKLKQLYFERKFLINT